MGSLQETMDQNGCFSGGWAGCISCFSSVYLMLPKQIRSWCPLCWLSFMNTPTLYWNEPFNTNKMWPWPPRWWKKAGFAARKHLKGTVIWRVGANTSDWDFSRETSVWWCEGDIQQEVLMSQHARARLLFALNMSYLMRFIRQVIVCFIDYSAQEADLCCHFHCRLHVIVCIKLYSILCVCI